ncbi:MAG: glycosyltransferase [Candidatus Kapaibacterium sp.]
MTLSLMIVLFWLSVIGIVHTYLVFPLLIRLIAASGRSVVPAVGMNEEEYAPAITVVISAYNEEKNIRERIEDLARCEYPAGKMSVVVGSDGSTDATNTILEELSLRYDWLTVIPFATNRGKTPVLNRLFASITTPLTVLTDADTVFSPNALSSIVRPFRDETVGCVAGVRRVRDMAVTTVTSLQESSYLDLDNGIRVAEGRLGCVIGAHGSLYALRTELVGTIPEDKPFTDDFYLSMIPLERGFRVVQADTAISYAETAASTLSDFRRKVRYSSTAFATCFRFLPLLWGPRPIVAYCFFSHRVSRWFLPVFLVIALVSNMVLRDHAPVYAIALIVQSLFYLTALVGILVPSTVSISRLFSLSAYFVYSNAALLVGLVRWAAGGASHRWEPSLS